MPDSGIENDRIKDVNRRQFLGNLLKTVCGVGLLGAGLGL